MPSVPTPPGDRCSCSLYKNSSFSLVNATTKTPSVAAKIAKITMRIKSALCEGGAALSPGKVMVLNE